MLKFKLKENCIDKNSQNPITDYLFSLGIYKVDSFLHAPPEEDELSPTGLINCDRCVEELHKGFTNNKKFFIQVDSDVDGYTSSSIFYRYFKLRFPNANIVWRLHEGKEHGVIINTVPEDADYVILPDSGSMQLEEQLELANAGKTVIILDHHSVSSQNNLPNVILVNNQASPNFSNKDLSGAGVVFKIIQAYELAYPSGEHLANKFYDLAALGILSDMMNMRNLDNNYIVYQGLHNINNKMFLALLEKQAYSIKDINNPTKIDTVFYVSPLINGVIRAGTQEEKELLFRGFIEEPTSEYIDTTWRNEERHETYYQYMARTSYNIKNRQNTEKEKCFEFLKKKIQSTGLDKHQVIAVVASKTDEVVVPQNITGLIAMELLKEYNKPVLVLRPKMEGDTLTYAGSGRAKQADNFNSFLQFMKDSYCCSYAEGHAMAFGAAIAADEYEKFLADCDIRLGDIVFDNTFIEVDAVFENDQINKKMLLEFAEHSEIYGNSIPQPEIAFTGIISGTNIRKMGKDLSTVKFEFGGISCIKFKDKTLADSIDSNKRYKYTIIGRPQINEWMGYKNIQIAIEAIELEELQVTSLF